MMKQRSLRRRVLKRRLKRQRDRAEKAVNKAQVAAIEAVLANKHLQYELLDEIKQLRKVKEKGDGSFLDFLKSIDWEKLLELIWKIISKIIGGL